MNFKIPPYKYIYAYIYKYRNVHIYDINMQRIIYFSIYFAALFY